MAPSYPRECYDHELAPSMESFRRSKQFELQEGRALKGRTFDVQSGSKFEGTSGNGSNAAEMVSAVRTEAGC
jgi:hypothetical protein